MGIYNSLNESFVFLMEFRNLKAGNYCSDFCRFIDCLHIHKTLPKSRIYFRWTPYFILVLPNDINYIRVFKNGKFIFAVRCNCLWIHNALGQLLLPPLEVPYEPLQEYVLDREPHPIQLLPLKKTISNLNDVQCLYL